MAKQIGLINDGNVDNILQLFIEGDNITLVDPKLNYFHLTKEQVMEIADRDNNNPFQLVGSHKEEFKTFFKKGRKWIMLEQQATTYYDSNNNRKFSVTKVKLDDRQFSELIENLK